MEAVQTRQTFLKLKALSSHMDDLSSKSNGRLLKLNRRRIYCYSTPSENKPFSRCNKKLAKSFIVLFVVCVCLILIVCTFIFTVFSPSSTFLLLSCGEQYLPKDVFMKKAEQAKDFFLVQGKMGGFFLKHSPKVPCEMTFEEILPFNSNWRKVVSNSLARRKTSL